MDSASDFTTGPEASRITRRFSQDSATQIPQDDLVQALARREDNADLTRRQRDSLVNRWQELFQPGIITNLSRCTEERQLEEQTRDLAQAWLKFQKCVPESGRKNVKSPPPNLEDVMKAAVSVEQAWHEKQLTSSIGKWKGRFGKLCRKLGDHEDLFKIIPSGDKYVCLLAGSITAIVKATANHEKIAEGISRAFENFSDDIPYWKKLAQPNRGNPTMAQYIERLYVVIFKFLTDIMEEWSSASSFRRLLKSFDAGYVDNRLNAMRLDILNLTRMLEREDRLDFHADVRNRLQEMPNREYIDQTMIISLNRFGTVLQRDLREKLGEDVQILLHSTVEKLIQDSRCRIEPATTPLSTEETVALDAPATNQGSLSASVKATVRPLGHYFQVEVIQALADDSENLHLGHHVFQRLQGWYTQNVNRTLWICGHPLVPRPSRNTLTAAYIAETARLASVPVIAHFCDSDGTQQSKQDAIVDMTWSLIYQIGHQLPDDAVSKVNLSSFRFESIARTIGGLPSAIQLLQDLISIGPSLVFCVIDGLENVTPLMGYQGCVENLIKALSPVDDHRHPRVVKTLFTTDGWTDSLASLDYSDVVSLPDLERFSEADASVGATSMAFLH